MKVQSREKKSCEDWSHTQSLKSPMQGPDSPGMLQRRHGYRDSVDSSNGKIGQDKPRGTVPKQRQAPGV